MWMLVRPKDKCIWTFHNNCSKKFQSYLKISYFLKGDAALTCCSFVFTGGGHARTHTTQEMEKQTLRIIPVYKLEKLNIYDRTVWIFQIFIHIYIHLLQAHDQPQMSQECVFKFTQATSTSQFKYIVLKHPWFLEPGQCYSVIQSYCFHYPKASKALKHSAVILVLLSIFFHACQENVTESVIPILAQAYSWLFGSLCCLRV